MRLAQQWPVDKKKSGRDLGMLVRQRIASTYREREATVIADAAKCDRIYAAFQRIVNDHYLHKYPRNTELGALGLTVDKCRFQLSTEEMKKNEKLEKVGFFRRLGRRLARRRPSSSHDSVASNTESKSS